MANISHYVSDGNVKVKLHEVRSRVHEADEAELRDILKVCERELFDLRTQAMLQQLPNPMRIRHVRKLIARVQTELTARAKGINSSLQIGKRVVSIAVTTNASPSVDGSSSTNDALLTNGSLVRHNQAIDVLGQLLNRFASAIKDEHWLHAYKYLQEAENYSIDKQISITSEWRRMTNRIEKSRNLFEEEMTMALHNDIEKSFDATSFIVTLPEAQAVIGGHECIVEAGVQMENTAMFQKFPPNELSRLVVPDKFLLVLWSDANDVINVKDHSKLIEVSPYYSQPQLVQFKIYTSRVAEEQAHKLKVDIFFNLRWLQSVNFSLKIIPEPTEGMVSI